MKKTISLLLAFVLVIGATVAGTMAYLHAETDTVQNTFTVGKVAITLTETDEDRQFEVTPGMGTIDKDPTVTVVEGSRPCYVFLTVKDENMSANGLTYSVDAAWGDVYKTLTDGTLVYCREVTEVVEDNLVWNVLTDNKVNVSDDIESFPTVPTLTFKAYAIQSENLDVDTAFAKTGIQ